MKNGFLRNSTLIFDLDGTLVDTAPDLIHALNHVLASIDCPLATETHIRPFISFGARRMIIEGLAVNGMSMSDEEIDRLLDIFLDFYASNLAVSSAPYPNLAETLDTATKAGALLGVCTNKREDLSLSLLRELELHDRFKAIVGRDTLDVCKPHPRHLTETVARAGGHPARSVMIGDSPTDVKTAKAAGIPVVAVSFGYSEVAPEELGADALIRDYADLIGVLPQLLGK